MTGGELTLRDFQRYFPHTPTALAIKECVRLAKMQGLACEGPILDVGCGDGLFARLAFNDADVWGIDIDAGEGRRAQASQVYSQILLADITRAKLPAAFFGSCVANCSLEHVRDLGAALKTIRDALRPGAPLHAFLPNRDWAEHMLVPRLLKRARLSALAASFTEAVNQTFRHEHLEDAGGWRRWFERAGFEVERVEPMGSTASTVMFELFLAPSLLGLLNKKITGRWTNLPRWRGVAATPVYTLIRTLLAFSSEREHTAEFLLTARRPLNG